MAAMRRELGLASFERKNSWTERDESGDQRRGDNGNRGGDVRRRIIAELQEDELAIAERRHRAGIVAPGWNIGDVQLWREAFCLPLALGGRLVT